MAVPTCLISIPRVTPSAVCFLVAVIWAVAVAASALARQVAENNGESLEYWIGHHEEVVILPCTKQPTSREHPLLRVLPKAFTLWSHPDENFYNLYRRKTMEGVTMVIILLSDRGEEHVCAQVRNTVRLGTHVADWIILRVDNVTRGTGAGARPHRPDARGMAVSEAVSLDCKRWTAPPPKGQACLSLQNAIALSRKRGFPKSDREGRLSAEFNGQKIALACSPLRKVGHSGIMTCDAPFPQEIVRALRSYNTTLIFRHFKDLDRATAAVVYGDADILMTVSKEDEVLFELFAVPRPMRYTYETFYSMRNLHIPEVSFFVVLLDSREGFCILLVVMIVVWLAMGVRDYYYMDALRLDRVLDYGMFLVASFLASSTALPMEGAENRRYMSRLSRVSILTTWMLAILPLSVYFRGELTSRLAVAVPHDQMDTLEKLEHALDRAAVQLCISDFGCMSAVLSGIVPYRNETLLAKMQRAFRLQRPGTENVFNTQEGCLECANKPGFACFTCKLEGCGAELFKRSLVESQEPLNLAVATMPATKGYRLARAYDTLLQRMFETALSPFSEQHENCEAHKWLMQEVEEAESGQEIGQVIELSAFLATFACLMGLSICVFCVELVFGMQHAKLFRARL